mgnify:FL=1
MTKYVVHYEMRLDSKSATYTKTVECDNEYTAIEVAKSQGRRDKPEYEFNLKKIERK